MGNHSSKLLNIKVSDETEYLTINKKELENEKIVRSIELSFDF